MEPNWKEIGNRLRISREILPIGKKEAALAIGLTKRALAYHESGSKVKPDLIKRYAEIYNVDPHWLMTGKTTASRVTEQTGLYGITSETVIDGKTMRVTSYAPDEKDEPEGNLTNVQSDLSRSVSLLAELMQNGDSAFRDAIISNLEAFTSVIAKDRLVMEQRECIRKLTEENAELTKRLDEAIKVTEKLDRIEKIIKEHYRDPKSNRSAMKKLYNLIDGNSLLK